MWMRPEGDMGKETGTTKERGLAHGVIRIGSTRQIRTMSHPGMHSKETSRRQTIGEEDRKETFRPLQKEKAKENKGHSTGDALRATRLDTRQQIVPRREKDSKENATIAISLDTARRIALLRKAKEKGERKANGEKDFPKETREA